MKLHRNARTCPKSRRLLVDRLEGDWSLTEAAEAAGVSERTACKWLDRYRTEGEEGLQDRSSAPHAMPNRQRQGKALHPNDARRDLPRLHRRTAALPGWLEFYNSGLPS